MPQLEKYAFFTQLFWFFLLFFSFFLLLLQFVLPSIARSLKFRQKLLSYYRSDKSLNDVDPYKLKDLNIAATTLALSEKFGNVLQANLLMIKNANIVRYDRTRFLSLSYKYEVYKTILTYLYLLRARKRKAYFLCRQAFSLKKNKKKLFFPNATITFNSKTHSIDVRWYGKRTNK